MQKTTHVKYLDRVVPREGFRAYVYDAEQNKKLMNSYDDYESHIATGCWYACKPEIVIKAKGRQKREFTNDSARVRVPNVPANQCIEPDDTATRG